jgi:hypothetical protein
MDKRLVALTLFLVSWLVCSCGSSGGGSYNYSPGNQCPLNYNPFNLGEQGLQLYSFDGSQGPALPPGKYVSPVVDYVYYAPIPNPSDATLPHDIIVHVQEQSPTGTNAQPVDKIQCIRNASTLKTGMAKPLTVISAMQIVPGQPITYSTRTIGFQTSVTKSMVYGFQSQSAVQSIPTPTQFLSGMKYFIAKTDTNSYELHGQVADVNNVTYTVRIGYTRIDLPAPAVPPTTTQPPPAPPAGATSPP